MPSARHIKLSPGRASAAPIRLVTPLVPILSDAVASRSRKRVIDAISLRARGGAVGARPGGVRIQGTIDQPARHAPIHLTVQLGRRWRHCHFAVEPSDDHRFVITALSNAVDGGKLCRTRDSGIVRNHP